MKPSFYILEVLARPHRAYPTTNRGGAVPDRGVQRVRHRAITVSVILAGLLPIMWSHGTGPDGRRCEHVVQHEAARLPGQLLRLAWHAYPWLIHRLAHRRTNHDNSRVRGYKEEGTITTPFEMTVLNDLDGFPLREGHHRPPAAERRQEHLPGGWVVEHQQYIRKNGEDLPEIRNWKA